MSMAGRMKGLGALLLVWVTLGAPEGGRTAWGQPPAARAATKFQPDANYTAERFMRSAAGNARERQWAEAIDLYQRVIQDFGDAVAQVQADDPAADPEGRSTLYVDARLSCHRRIAALPAEARALYRRRVDPQAARWFEEAQARQDRALFRRIVQDAYCSSYGDDALDALGDIAFREGRFSEALNAYGQLVPGLDSPPGALVHPDPSVDLARVAAKKLLCQAALGEAVPTPDDLNGFDQTYPKAQAEFAGRSGPLLEGLITALRDHAFTAPSVPDTGWSTFAGAPSRTKVARSEIDIGSLQWKVALTAYPPLTRSFGTNAFAMRTSPLGPTRPDRGLAYLPIVVGEKVILCDTDRLFAYNMSDRPGATEGAAGTETAEPRFAWKQALSNGIPRDNSRLGQVVPPRHTVTAYGDRVYARLGPPAGQGVSTLVVVENSREVEGKLLQVRASVDIALPRRNGAGGRAAFEGTPVADARNVYIGLTESSNLMTSLHVASLDGRTLETRWVRSIGEASSPIDLMMNQVSADDVGNRLLTLDGGTLYYQTNLGAVAALDAETGTIKWLATYPHSPQAPRFGFGRDLNPAIVHDDLVIVAPDDATDIFAFDVATGRLVWRSSLPDGIQDSTRVTHLLGVAKGRLIATGNKVWSFDARTGKLLSYWPETGPGFQGHGRGLLAGDSIYWPTKTEIHVLDQATGRKGDREAIPLQAVFGVSGGNLAVGDGYLVVATEDTLAVFCENSRLIDRYKQLIVQAPNEAAHHVRLARVAEAIGQDELALESLASAMKVARPAELLDGEPLAELAAAQRYRLLVRLAEKAAGAADWAAAAARYATAAEAALSDRDRLAARLLLAGALERQGTPSEAVRLLQGLLAEEKLRTLTVAADERRTVRADLLIADRLVALLRAHGRDLYADYEKTARELFERGTTERDPRLLEEVGRSYPIARIVPDALLALGQLHEAQGHPAEAARAYKKLLAAASEDATRARALLGLARAYEAQAFWVPARDAYARAQGRYAELRLDGPDLTVGSLVAERLGAPPFDAMTGDRSEPALPVPLARLWAADWPGHVRPIAAEGVPPSAGAGRIFLVEGQALRPIDPTTGRYGWSADLGGEALWVAYLTDRVFAATPNRLVALDVKTGDERWHIDAGNAQPPRGAPNPFVRPAPPAPAGAPPARLTDFRLVGGRIYCRRGDRELLALDGETGLIDWAFSPIGKATINPRLWVGNHQIILQVRGPNAVVVLDATTGAPRAEFPQTEQDEPWARDPFPIDDDHVALVPDLRTVVLYDLENGVAAWTYREPSALPRSGPPRLLGDSGRLFVLRDGSELVRLDPANGRKLWSKIIGVEDLSEWPDAIALDGDRVYVATNGGSSQILTAYTLADGELTWRRHLAGPRVGWCLTLSDECVVAYPSPARSIDGEMTMLPLVLVHRDSGRLVERFQFTGPVTSLAVRLTPNHVLVATQAHGWALGVPTTAAPVPRP